MRSVVSAAAGKAANIGASSVGGPVLGVVADKAAAAAADAILSQVLEAETDILSRLDEINQEMRGRLIGLQAGVDSLLDKDYRAAQLHLEEAARLPERRAQELQTAKSKLFDAWGAANTPMRRYLVAQHLVIVFALLGDAQMVIQWLRTSYKEIRAEILDQVSRLHKTVVDVAAQIPVNYERNRTYNNSRGEFSGARYKGKDAISLQVTVFGVAEADALRVLRTPSMLSPGDYLYGTADLRIWDRYVRWGGYLPRSADLEGWLSGLATLDAESAGVRRLCEIGGVPEETLPAYRWQHGAVRIYKGDTSGGGGFGWQPGVLVHFSPSVAVQFSILSDKLLGPRGAGGARKLAAEIKSPLCEPLPVDLRRALGFPPELDSFWDIQDVWRSLGTSTMINARERYYGLLSHGIPVRQTGSSPARRRKWCSTRVQQPGRLRSDLHRPDMTV